MSKSMCKWTTFEDAFQVYMNDNIFSLFEDEIHKESERLRNLKEHHKFLYMSDNVDLEKE